MKTVMLSAAQMTCQDGEIHDNLEHATTMIAQASQRGAQLILFPEFMPQCYCLTPKLWDSAETFNGQTVHWLCEMGRTYGLYIGTSFLEARDGRFLNTFALATPDGTVAGQVGKRNPSIWEAYFFESIRGSQFLDTDLGRIGVGICFDNHTFEVACSINLGKVDLMLMPHSYCTPTRTSKAISQADIKRLNRMPGQVARMYNQWFGIPVMMCNKSGPWNSSVPSTILGQPKDYWFCGGSIILDGDGQVKDELGNEEAIAIGEVTLNPHYKKASQPPRYVRYIYPGPAGREVLRLFETIGRLNYNRSKLRKQKALEITNRIIDHGASEG